MSMLTPYLKQEATWLPAGDYDEWGNSTGTGTSIKVRWVPKTSSTLDAAGNVILTEHEVLTEAAVQTGDQLTYDGADHIVARVEGYVDLSGKTIGRKVYC